jgi:hypothetical protein
MLRYSIGATDPTWTALMTQITRLEQLKNFPYGPEAKKDLGKALAHAISIDDARDVIDEFVHSGVTGDSSCPTYADLVALINQRATRNAPPEPKPEPEQSKRGSHCSRCQGFGFYGGQISGQYAGPWKWCRCENGSRAKSETPEIIDSMNANRDELMRRFAVSMKRAGATPEPTLKPVAEEYHGDF